MSYAAVEKRFARPEFQLCSVGDLHDAHLRGEKWQLQCGTDAVFHFQPDAWGKVARGCIVLATLLCKAPLTTQEKLDKAISALEYYEKYSEIYNHARVTLDEIG